MSEWPVTEVLEARPQPEHKQTDLAYVGALRVGGPRDDTGDGQSYVTGVSQLGGIHRLTQAVYVVQYGQL